LSGTGDLTSVFAVLLRETIGDGREVGATLHAGCPRKGSMIANYTDHAANERTFLALIRTGLAAAAFGFFLIKLNIFVDVLGGGSIFILLRNTRCGRCPICRTGNDCDWNRRHRAKRFSPLSARVARSIAMSLSGSAESLLSAALAIVVLIFCLNLARI
jgi:putative membrane protein